ncbi:MAG: ParA family protein, partial [Alphaproteobacteria bacterium]|nr:ParA family protein [Alphaproteobacteria bacterium]
MRVIVLASQKGGSGKTTLAGHLAVEAERTGFAPVAIIDTDPQGSLQKWSEARYADTPAYCASDLASLRSTLIRCRAEGYRLVVIDTPPSITRAISDVLSFADLVVMPTRPSPHDIRAVGLTVDLVDYHRKPMIFVINGATPRARITSDAAVALSQHGTVAPTFMCHRVDYAASMIDGRTVQEVNPNGRSAREVIELWAYIAERLNRMDEVLNGVPDPSRFSPMMTSLSAFGRKQGAPGQPAAPVPPGATPGPG